MEEVRIGHLTKFYDYKFKEGYAFAGHTHEAWELNIVLEGRMSVTYGGDVMTLSQGDFFIGEPWGFHCNRALGNGVHMAVIHFTESNIPTGKGSGYSVRTLCEDELSAARLMIGELSGLFDVSGEPTASEESLANARKLCEVLVSRVIGSGGVPQSENSSPRAGIYREAIRFMEENVHTSLTVSDISRALHVSPALLKRVFLEYTGGGVMSCFTLMRIRLARRMLEHGDGVTLVSDTLGFSSGCYFSTVFTRLVGETPKRYQMRFEGRMRN